MIRFSRVAFLSTVMIGAVYSAQDIQLNGTHKQILSLPNRASDAVQLQQNSNGLNKKSQFTKSVRILNIQLSQHAKQTMEHHFQWSEDSNTKDNQYAIQANRPSKVQLGMGNVPVLDQGPHGTCVTFAISAAIDAVLQKGDYVSQLCQLQLGRYLEENALSYMTGGWDGSFGRDVLGQVATFGIVSKHQEAAYGCGGLKVYPMDNESTPSSTLNLDEFHQMSEDVTSTIERGTILDIDDAFRDDLNRTEILNKVKASLAKGDRVTFATVLFNMDDGIVGAVGFNRVKNDTWLFTPEMERDFEYYTDFGLHEMVITGFDDQATVTDNNGRLYKGVLTIRNSWGDKVADQGNFYMTYDYFKNFVVEAHRIGKSTD